MTSTRSVLTDLAAALSIGAALVHAAAAGTHTGDTVLVALFAGAALVQGAIGVALLPVPSRRVLVAGGVVNLLAVGAWMASRTVGLPIIDALADVEAVGTQDLSAAALAAGSAACALAVARRPLPLTSLSRLGWVPVLALVPALVGVAAPHAHSDSHAHDHGDAAEVAAGDHAAGETGHAGDHAEGEAGHAGDHAAGAAGHAADHAEQSEVAAQLAADPVLAGADTAAATEEELTAAIAIVDDTRAAVNELTTTEAAEAAGYVWIGDGRRPGGFQHYINHEYLGDGIELDPEHIESLVFENTAGGPVLVSTMYLLDMGSTMDDVPEVAGDLTVWHDHQNLCWDASGTRLAGISDDAKTCRPAGELRATPPMLHVWVDDNECGPFAGIEGHGGDGCASHDDH